VIAGFLGPAVGNPIAGPPFFPGSRIVIQPLLIAIDLDGTLVRRDGSLSPANRDALHKAHDSGAKIVLCTGRALPETRPVLEKIGLDLDAVITAGGAMISDARSGETLHSTAIPDPVCHDAVAWFVENEYCVIWLHDGRRHDNDGFAIAGPRRHTAVDYWLSRTACTIRAVPATPAGAGSALRLTIIDDDGPLRALAPRFAARFDGRMSHNVIHVRSYDFTVLECFDATVNKWTAIQKLCAGWNLPESHTAAIGDDVNDIPMLRHAGVGLAVENATAEVQAVASRCVRRGDEDGVAEAINWLLGAEGSQQHLWLRTHESK
jgi:5-amino-6-(5-phospho-D-ribitylamino)uracil phosphatase